MNGHAIPDLAAPPVNVEMVRTLEVLLAQARSGQMISMAAVYSFGPNHVDMKIHTKQPLELYLGVDILKQTLFNHMTNPQASKILRAVPGG